MEEIEARVTALENQVGAIRQDAAAARVLAGGADRDVSAFGAKLDMHKKLLDALRETQIEQGETLKEHGEILKGQGETLKGQGETLKGQSETLKGQSETLKGQGEILKGHSREFVELKAEMRGGFAMLAANQAKITTLLERHLATDE